MLGGPSKDIVEMPNHRSIIIPHKLNQKSDLETLETQESKSWTCVVGGSTPKHVRGSLW